MGKKAQMQHKHTNTTAGLGSLLLHVILEMKKSAKEN